MGKKREIDQDQLTDMNDLVMSSIRIFGKIKKEIRFHGRYARHLWTTAGDAEQMEHLLVNLYVSAWQAMHDGGDIYLESENVRLDECYTRPLNAPAGSYIKISVSATDVDMGEAAQQPFFGPYFIMKEKGPVKALGLTSASEIVHSHGGFIKVHNGLGRGRTVSFFLPAVRGKADNPAQLPFRLPKGSENIIMMNSAALPAYNIAR